ncbi:MAG: hypothetical protein AB7S26_23940 [Sandaracinaceae bacterium]
MTRASALLAALALAGGVFAGCVFEPIDVTGKACPCPDGFVCANDVCVNEASFDAGTDAGATDAGVRVDAADRDAAMTADAGASVCPATAFCEDFEGSNPAGNGWTPFPRDMNVVRYINTTRPSMPPGITPHGGTGMLQVITRTPGGQSEIVICPFTGFVCPDPAMSFDAGVPNDGGTLDLPGITSGDLHMRAYVLAPTTLPSGQPFVMGHASVMHLGMHQGAYRQESVLGFNLDVDHTQMYVGTGGVGRVEPRPSSGDPDTRPPFPRDTWVCVQTSVHVDPVAGSVATYLTLPSDPTNPMLVVERTDIDTVALLPWRHFGVGLGYTSEMPNGASLFIDDVAFGPDPIPCLE